MEDFKGKYIFDNKYSNKCDAFFNTMAFIERHIASAKGRAFFSTNPNRFELSINLYNEGNFQGWMYREMLIDIITVLRQKGYIVSCNDLNLCITGDA